MNDLVKQANEFGVIRARGTRGNSDLLNEAEGTDTDRCKFLNYCQQTKQTNKQTNKQTINRATVAQPTYQCKPQGTVHSVAVAQCTVNEPLTQKVRKDKTTTTTTATTTKTTTRQN